MNGTLKETERKLLSLFSQLLIIISTIQILTLLMVENTETSFLWVTLSGFFALGTGLAVFADSNRRTIIHKWVLLACSLICLVAYVFAVNMHNEPRMYVGLLTSLIIMILLIQR
ncbi:MAG: hypothetical protein MUF45_19035 [Spirosomaceae bacterium]|jgi:peptidoglycan/LPS O-acetylase OafA/YrhL|nr:hypothetical protein [Spirosomataceae bacterium]